MSDRSLSAATLAAALVAAAAAAFALLAPPADPGLFWRLSSGGWMLDHGALLDHDVFSFTRAGVPYQSGGWLAEVVFAIAYRAGGWLGIVVLRASLVAVGTFFACRAVFRVQPHLGWAAVPVGAMVVEARTIWIDGPQLFSFALLPLVFSLLLASRLDGRPRTLALLPPIFLVWANLDGAFLAGLGLVAVFAVEALFARERRAARPLALAFAASLVASLVNPAGLGAIVASATYSPGAGAQAIEEGPVDVLGGRGPIFAAFLLASLGGALVLGRERLGQAVGAPAALWAGVIVPFALWGLATQREAAFACVVMAPFVAAAIPWALARPRPRSRTIPRALATAVLAVVALALVVEASAVAARAPDLSAYPVAAMSALASNDGRVLNEYDWGGFLIWSAPSHPVFVDGRGAALYSADVLADFDDAVRLRPRYREILDRWQIKLALLRSARPLAVALRDAGWRVLAEDAGSWVLLVRP